MTDDTGRSRIDVATEPGAGRPDRASARARPAPRAGRDDMPGPLHREPSSRPRSSRSRTRILRMGSLVAEQVVAAIARARASRRRGRARGHHRRRELNGDQRDISGLVSRTIATQQPVARDLRFLLTLDHVAYDLERMGDHAASVAKQARKLAPIRAARGVRAACPRWVASSPSRCATSSPPSSTSMTTRARAGGRQRRRGGRSVPRHLRRDARTHARRPGQRRPRRAHPLRRALPRAHRRPRHEHRRGRRLPGHRGRRRPQSLSHRRPRRPSSADGRAARADARRATVRAMSAVPMDDTIARSACTCCATRTPATRRPGLATTRSGR